ncbi:MAG TPA: squalene synthase HpnC [Nocardioides sp.]|uniref:squalene synthase HpnC n=1 Tax=Nocardioides sp. TaxID=35761 RepID=UPI002E331450|nr:squalene synthase HpnC [Nocardioides sp.]HEX3930871.1 squalene synthase HpnC [Nocardioides sp.]
MPSTAALRARETGENFPVALRILPRHHREALHAVYAFARTVDEAGDSWPGDRLARLGELDDAVIRTWSGRPMASTLRQGLDAAGSTGDRVVFERLARAGVPERVPEEWFHRLVEANIRDQRVTRYPTYAALLGYCRLSADPIGRIVLYLFGEHAGTNPELSDQVCTALQLLEHWQDVAEDRRAGRIYLPREDLARYAVGEDDLLGSGAAPALAALMRFETDRAARLLAEGAPLVGRLHGWARLCVGGFVAGGEATVSALRRTGGDVLARPTAPSTRGTAAALLRLLVTGRGRKAVA